MLKYLYKQNKTNNICQIIWCRYYYFNCLSFFFARLLKMFWCNLLSLKHARQAFGEISNQLQFFVHKVDTWLYVEGHCHH